MTHVGTVFQAGRLKSRAGRTLVGFLLPLLAMAACTGIGAGAKESWTIVELITRGEHIEASAQVVDVRHCGSVPEVKSFSCSAGTESSFSTTLGVGVKAGLAIEGSVSNGLGFDRSRGESLDLEAPPPDHVNRYVIVVENRVVAGEALARTSGGKEQSVDYTFQASCALRIDSVEQITCEEASRTLPTVIPPSSAPVIAPQPVAPSSSSAGTSGGNILGPGEIWSQGGIEMRLKNPTVNPGCLGTFGFELSAVNVTDQIQPFDIHGLDITVSDDGGNHYSEIWWRRGGATGDCYDNLLEDLAVRGDLAPGERVDLAFRVMGFIYPPPAQFDVHILRAGPIANARWRISTR